MSEETVEAATEEKDFVVAEDSQPERPEWLPEKYNTGEDLAKAYTELSSKLGQKEDDLRSKFHEELQAEAFKDRPETSGGYEIPEGIDEESTLDSDLLKWWSEHSFENGFSQDEFNKGLEMYTSAISANQPDLDAEAKKLGDNSNARIEAAGLFANQFFGEEHMPAIERLAESADGIIALEFIMEKMKTPSVNGDSVSASKVTEENLREMMQDERYWHPARRSNDFVKEVDSGFKTIYG